MANAKVYLKVYHIRFTPIKAQANVFSHCFSAFHIQPHDRFDLHNLACMCSSAHHGAPSVGQPQ
jgi:hypothetical protein